MRLIILISILLPIFIACDNNSTGSDLGNTVVFPNYISTDKLVAYYSFDNNVKDMSSNENNGIYKAIKFTQDKNGKALHAIEFSGDIKQYVEIPIDSSLNTPDEITISTWIYKKSDTTYQAIASRYIDSNYNYLKGWNFAFMSAEYGGHLYFYFQDISGNYTSFQSIDSIASKILNGWHHIAMTFSFGNGKKGNMYLDGQEIQTEWYGTGRNYNKMPVEMNNNLFIGISKAGPNGTRFHQFNGILDEMIIYSRKITAIEVEELMNGFLSQ